MDHLTERERATMAYNTSRQALIVMTVAAVAWLVYAVGSVAVCQ